MQLKSIRKSIFLRRGLAALFFMIIITLVVLGVKNVSSINEMDKVWKQNSDLVDMKGQVIYLDEVLTMSARMAAVTGNFVWEKRYNHFTIKLDSVMKEILKSVANNAMAEFVKSTDTANMKLVKMESEAFSLVKQNQLLIAQSVLFSNEYVIQKAIYKSGMDKLFILIKNAETGYKNNLVQTNKISKWIFFGSLFIIALVFYFMIKQTRKIIEFKNNLKEQDEKHGTTLNSVDDGIISADKNGNIIYMNPSAEKLTGWKMKEAFQQPLEKVYNVYNEETGESFENIVSRILKTGKTIEFENSTILKSKNAVNYIISNSGSPILDSNGKMLGAVLVFKDLTTQKLIEKRLIESEMKYRSLFENMQDGIYKSSPQGKFIEVNPAMVSMLGYSNKDELMNIDIKSELYFKEAERETDVLQSGSKESEIYRLRKKDGTELWVEDNSRYVLDNKGEVLYHEGSLREITERKKSEDELRLNKFAIDNAGDAIVWMTPDSCIVNVNEATSKMLGYSQQELLHLFIPDIDPEFNAEVWPQHFNELRKKGALFFESTQKTKDGRIIPVEITANYIKVGETELNCAFVRDISVRKKDEQKLLNQNTELQKINLELDKFVYSTSHDLRVPLTSIMGLINLWKIEKDSSVQFEYLKMMEQSVKMLDDTIIEILDYSRNSRIALQYEKVSISEMVNEIFINTQFIEGKENIGRLISINESTQLVTDKFRLKIILSNLISNAIKYSKKINELSFIEIKAEVFADKAIITIADNGIGIEASSITKIFDIFFRGTAEATGSGLGLYIVKETVNKMQGTISVESVKNEGTIFKLEIPNTNPVKS